MQPKAAPAFVEFRPIFSLNADKDMWDEGDENFPSSRRILAHEIGHLVMHDFHAQPFSGTKDEWIQEEFSAEWQADRFAEYFLISDVDARSYATPSSIASYCAVDYETAARRLGRKFRFLGDSCLNCGNFTLVSVGTCRVCDTCGWAAC
jgi:IrrE N-terminal-like domain